MPVPCVELLPSAPLLFWMVPPDPAVPLPVMVKAPEPVVSSVTPLLVPPLDVMLRNVRPDAPMVVPVTLSALPVVVVSVLTIEVLFCVALTVPPPVAVKASLVAVDRVKPPVQLKVAPVLEFRKTPRPVPLFEVMAPPKANVPPFLLWTSMARAAVVCVIVPL